MRLSAKEASALKVILLAVLSITALGVAGWLMWALRSVLGLALAAAFAAFLFLPVAYWLNRKRTCRWELPVRLSCWRSLLCWSVSWPSPSLRSYGKHGPS